MNADGRVLKAAAVVVLAGLSLFVALTALSPLDRTYSVFFESAGYVERGEKFGVAIGMSPEDAEAVLLSNGLTIGSNWRNRCGGREAEAAETMKLYLDMSWRHGAVCTFVAEGSVRAVAWAFNPMAP